VLRSQFIQGAVGGMLIVAKLPMLCGKSLRLGTPQTYVNLPAKTKFIGNGAACYWPVANDPIN